MVIGKREIAIKSEVTVGNIASIVTTFLGIGGLIWGGAVALTTMTDRLNVLERTRATVESLANLDQRVINLEKSDVRQEAIMAARMKLADERWTDVQKDKNEIGGRMVGVETSLKFVLQGIQRIENKLDETKKGGAQ